MKKQGAKILEKKETQGDGHCIRFSGASEEVVERLRSSTEGDKFMNLRVKPGVQRLQKRRIQIAL